ncbi:MAG: glycosyltransferase [Myxococcus sp.]|nr:glycosyltransferase [Myxococcus sp.]
MSPVRVIVVPCYNEAARIELPRFSAFFDAGVQLLFVNDGSTDDTGSLLAALVAKHPGQARLHSLARNSGKAEAVRHGLNEALAHGATIVGYTDADLATPPPEMLRVLDSVQGTVQVALGSRVALLGRRIERSPRRHYLGRVFATAASLALGVRVYDTQCGAKAFLVTDGLRDALARPFASRWAFDVELLERLLRSSKDLGMLPSDVVEVPLHEWRDVRGSKLSATAMLKAGLDLASIGVGRALRRP